MEQLSIEKGTKENFVRSRYPDAHCFKWATLSVYIRSTLCGRISGIFRTEEEAWSSAVEWINTQTKTQN